MSNQHAFSTYHLPSLCKQTYIRIEKVIFRKCLSARKNPSIFKNFRLLTEVSSVERDHAGARRLNNNFDIIQYCSIGDCSWSHAQLLIFGKSVLYEKQMQAQMYCITYNSFNRIHQGQKKQTQKKKTSRRDMSVLSVTFN